MTELPPVTKTHKLRHHRALTQERNPMPAPTEVIEWADGRPLGGGYGAVARASIGGERLVLISRPQSFRPAPYHPDRDNESERDQPGGDLQPLHPHEDARDARIREQPAVIVVEERIAHRW